MYLSGLFIYPVKSLRGCSVREAHVDELGLVGDRRFLVVDDSNRFLTQRVLPSMAKISTELNSDELTLSAAGAGSISVPVRVGAGTAELRAVTVFKVEGLLAQDCGDAVAKWLTSLLGTSCHLVRIGEEFRRPVTKSAAQPGDLVAFNDAVPFLAVSEASLADLNDRIIARGGDPVPMDRFRPNLVIADAPPYAEDTWPRVQVGPIILRSAGPCVRCPVTTTDQETGERGKEPLLTLAQYRRDAANPGNVMFAQNFIHETKRGILRLGDAVAPLAP